MGDGELPAVVDSKNAHLLVYQQKVNGVIYVEGECLVLLYNPVTRDKAPLL